MGILDVHQKGKIPEFEWNAPKYYDHPDGEDLQGKLSFIMKNTTAAATPLGVLYASVNPRPNTIGRIIRMARFILPGAAMGFTFTCVTYFATVLRKKDDAINHALGGAAAGCLLGPAMGNLGFSSIGLIIFGSSAFFIKRSHMNGNDFLQKTSKRVHSSYYLREFDTSRQVDVKGNWTKNA